MSNQAEDDHVSESPTNQNEMNQIMPTILNDCEIDANKSNIESIDQNAIKIDSNFELLQTIPLEIPKESNAVDCILPVGEPELIDSLDQLRSILRLDSKQFEQLEAWLSRETQNVEQKFEQHLTDLIKGNYYIGTFETCSEYDF